MHASPHSPPDDEDEDEDEDDLELNEPADEDADLEEVEVAAGFDMHFDDELDLVDEDMSEIELEFYLSQGREKTRDRAPVDSVWANISTQIDDFFKDP